ncbi:hypothetical protein AB0I55_29490 [Actinocatenispora sera]|uniref:hypothetical protein n=1 Tax=Actinocatenispora sera TaxID=390989 RepID=UPI0033C911EB
MITGERVLPGATPGVPAGSGGLLVRAELVSVDTDQRWRWGAPELTIDGAAVATAWGAVCYAVPPGRHSLTHGDVSCTVDVALGSVTPVRLSILATASELIGEFVRDSAADPPSPPTPPVTPVRPNPPATPTRSSPSADGRSAPPDPPVDDARVPRDPVAGTGVLALTLRCLPVELAGVLPPPPVRIDGTTSAGGWGHRLIPLSVGQHVVDCGPAGRRAVVIRARATVQLRLDLTTDPDGLDGPEWTAGRYLDRYEQAIAAGVDEVLLRPELSSPGVPVPAHPAYEAPTVPDGLGILDLAVHGTLPPGAPAHLSPVTALDGRLLTTGYGRWLVPLPPGAHEVREFTARWLSPGASRVTVDAGSIGYLSLFNTIPLVAPPVHGGAGLRVATARRIPFDTTTLSTGPGDAVVDVRSYCLCPPGGECAMPPTVFVDDEPVGMVAARWAVPVAAGRHWIRIVGAGMQPSTRAVDLAAGEVSAWETAHRPELREHRAVAGPLGASQPPPPPAPARPPTSRRWWLVAILVTVAVAVDIVAQHVALP